MLTDAPRALVKEANIVTSHRNLSSQLIRSLKSIYFNLKLSFFGFLNPCPGGTVTLTFLRRSTLIIKCIFLFCIID